MTSTIKIAGFVVTILMLAIFQCSTAQAERITFESKNLGTEDNRVLEVEGLLFIPDGEGPFPAVILLHTCAGLKNHVTEFWPNYLNSIGYAALAPDTHGSHNIEPCIRRGAIRALRAQIADAYGALNYLAKRPEVDGNRIAVMGFSRGAVAISLVLPQYSSREPGELNFRAAIAAYGLCFDYRNYHFPTLRIVPENDQSADTCTSIKNEPLVDVQVLPGAYHSFDSTGADGKTDYAGNVMKYSRSATQQAQELTKAFLAKHLGKRTSGPGQRIVCKLDQKQKNTAANRLLTEAEIRKIIIGNTLKFITPDSGKYFLFYFGPDGRVLIQRVGGGRIFRKK